MKRRYLSTSYAQNVNNYILSTGSFFIHRFEIIIHKYKKVINMPGVSMGFQKSAFRQFFCGQREEIPLYSLTSRGRVPIIYRVYLKRIGPLGIFLSRQRRCNHEKNVSTETQTKKKRTRFSCAHENARRS